MDSYVDRPGLPGLPGMASGFNAFPMGGVGMGAGLQPFPTLSGSGLSSLQTGGGPPSHQGQIPALNPFVQPPLSSQPPAASMGSLLQNMNPLQGFNLPGATPQEQQQGQHPIPTLNQPQSHPLPEPSYIVNLKPQDGFGPCREPFFDPSIPPDHIQSDFSYIYIFFFIFLTEKITSCLFLDEW